MRPWRLAAYGLEPIGCGADSGPSRGDLCRPASRPKPKFKLRHSTRFWASIGRQALHPRSPRDEICRSVHRRRAGHAASTGRADRRPARLAIVVRKIEARHHHRATGPHDALGGEAIVIGSRADDRPVRHGRRTLPPSAFPVPCSAREILQARGHRRFRPVDAYAIRALTPYPVLFP
jgi:hypothetical protein